MTTILIVEDNEMNRDMLSRRLERKGYTVLIAVDGQMGVEVARANSPDLILMDMSLPVGSHAADQSGRRSQAHSRHRAHCARDGK